MNKNPLEWSCRGTLLQTKVGEKGRQSRVVVVSVYGSFKVLQDDTVETMGVGYPVRVDPRTRGGGRTHVYPERTGSRSEDLVCARGLPPSSHKGPKGRRTFRGRVTSHTRGVCREPPLLRKKLVGGETFKSITF